MEKINKILAFALIGLAVMFGAVWKGWQAEKFINVELEKEIAALQIGLAAKPEVKIKEKKIRIPGPVRYKEKIIYRDGPIKIIEKIQETEPEIVYIETEKESKPIVAKILARRCAPGEKGKQWLAGAGYGTHNQVLTHFGYQYSWFGVLGGPMLDSRGKLAAHTSLFLRF